MKGRIRVAMKGEDMYNHLEVCAPLSRFSSDNLSALKSLNIPTSDA